MDERCTLVNDSEQGSGLGLWHQKLLWSDDTGDTDIVENRY